MPIKYTETYGVSYAHISGRFPKPVDELYLTFNTPVGVLQDSGKRIWVADTGNNRLLIFNSNMSELLEVYGRYGDDLGEFNLPFRMAHHPSKNWVYLTDLANNRVQILSYDEGLNITPVKCFSPKYSKDDSEFNPNGIVVYPYGDEIEVFVSDEFYHNGNDSSDLRGRIVVFDEQGDEQLRTFRGVKTANGTEIQLYWPQGLGIDADGRLYIANTGYGVLNKSIFANAVRCDRYGNAIDFAALNSPMISNLTTPRAVSVINGHIYIADVGTSSTTIYSLSGAKLAGPYVMQGPVHVSSIAGEHAVNTERILVSDAAGQKISIYGLPLNFSVASESFTPSGYIAPQISIGKPRDRQSQFNFVTASTEIPLYRGKSEQADLWVMDAVNDRLQHVKVPSPDKRLKSVQLSGVGLAQGIRFWKADDETGYFFVTDYLSHTVLIYRISLTKYLKEQSPAYRGSFGSRGNAQNQFFLPWGIDIRAADKDKVSIYIADSGNQRISIWEYQKGDTTAKPLQVFGTFGFGDGQFWNPSDVALDHDGNIFVADRNNNRIQVFSPDGGYERTIGRPGYSAEDSAFLLPQSVVIEGSYLFVNDLVNRAIKIFLLDGTPVTACQAFGGNPERGKMWFPYMLNLIRTSSDAHPKGYVMVPDATSNSVNAYFYELV